MSDFGVNHMMYGVIRRPTLCRLGDMEIKSMFDQLINVFMERLDSLDEKLSELLKIVSLIDGEVASSSPSSEQGQT